MKGNVDDHQQYDERRWSEVFPPHTALTFAAVWDPVEGMITFSGAHLLDSEGNEHIAATRPLPKDAVDSQSQALTIDMLLHHINNAPCQNAQNAYERDPSAWGCDAQTDTDGVNSQFLPQWLGVPHGLSTGLNSPAFASSAALTLMLPTEPDMPTMQQKYLNALRAAGGRIGGPTGVPLRPLHAHKESYDSDDTVTDEGFFEGSYLPNASCGSLPVLVNLNLVGCIILIHDGNSQWPLRNQGSLSPPHPPTGMSRSTSLQSSYHTTTRNILRSCPERRLGRPSAARTASSV